MTTTQQIFSQAEQDSGRKNTPMQKKAQILIVDDNAQNLTVLGEMLMTQYAVRVATSGEQALKAVLQMPLPDLILLDVMMPGMDGHAVLKKLRSNPDTASIPVIFVTAKSEADDEKLGLELGATDYICKPYDPDIVLARVRTQLALAEVRVQLAHKNLELEEKVAERTEMLTKALTSLRQAHGDLKKTHFGTLRAFSNLSKLRHVSVGEHDRRVAEQARALASFMGLSQDEVQEIFVAALLHDIGKLGFSDELLDKPVNRLSGGDLALYRSHPAIAAEALGGIASMEGVVDIIRNHHEHFDGSGYPKGLSGYDIPLGARIICPLSDYDDLMRGVAMTSRMSMKQSIRYFLDGSGSRYDPQIMENIEALFQFSKGLTEVEAIKVSARNLHEGMTLHQDITHPDGFMLLSKGTVLDGRLIAQISRVERDFNKALDIRVLRE